MNSHLQRFFAILLLSFACVAVSAQTGSASLTGVVTDPNGAVIPGVKVVATSTATGQSQSVVTNNEGAFVLTNLPVGIYEVSFTASGFTTTKVSSLSLNVGQTSTLNTSLEVRGIATDTEGFFYDSPIDIENSKVDSVISSKEIENLPLNGRNFLELALLTPGNAPAPNFDPTKTNTVLISSAGQLGRGSSVLIDGTDNNDDVVGGSLINISQDAVAEFQVATNRFSAEYGRSGSSVINVVTKSGTNSLRGSASFFERDKRLQGLPAVYDRTRPVPPFDRQQYSFTLGGPLVKDKIFAFGAFEYRDQDGTVLVERRDVATRSRIKEFAPSPGQDALLNTRLDYQVNDRNRLNFRYSFEDVDSTNASRLDRSIGSASYREQLKNRFHSFMAGWTNILRPTLINEFNFSVNNFKNTTDPTANGIQYTFPSILDGSSFRVPQATKQNRLQFTDALTAVLGDHTIKFGAEVQRVTSDISLGVFRKGRVEFAEDFATGDRNNDGRIDDNDLIFAVTLRSAFPDRDLDLPHVDNTHFAGFVQDNWRVRPNLTLNLGLRYQIDTNEKNNSGYGQTNPLVASFYRGDRKRDTNNFAPRVGFNYSLLDSRLSLHGGYGIYYDRVVLELITLERGLDGRALPVAVRAGNAFFLGPNGQFGPGAPTFSNPFSGFILPGAGASGINIIDNHLQNPMIQQSNLGVQWEFARNFALKVDYLHSFGTHFIIGRDIGLVNNPVVGGPDRVVNLESSIKTFYDGLLVSVEKRFSKRYSFRAGYTLSKTLNYANDDQIPFSNGPINSNNLQLEFGPTPNDQRHRFTLAGTAELPYGFRLSSIFTAASGVPMDILIQDASKRIPQLQRNAGGRLFRNAADLNAFIQRVNAAGGVNGAPLQLAPADAKFNDNFSSLDLRLTKVFSFNERVKLEPIVELFNVFNTTNILGISNSNYSGYGNVLGTKEFGRPITTAGGVFGSGGPRAVQLGVRFSF